MSKTKSFSAKAALAGAVLSAAALIGFTVYGMIYDYFDTVVFLALALGVAGMAAYALADKVWSELLNLAAVACITTESIFFPMRLLNRYIQNLTRMEAHSTPTDSQENAASSGWNTLIRLSFPSCRPSVSTRKATATPI